MINNNKNNTQYIKQLEQENYLLKQQLQQIMQNTNMTIKQIAINVEVILKQLLEVKKENAFLKMKLM